MSKFFKQILIFSSLFFLTAGSAFADLVWTKESGWKIEGGVLAQVFPDTGNVENALDAMNKGKEAQEEEDFSGALSYYGIVVKEYPNSIFAPEAYYQMGIVYAERGQFKDSFKSFDHIVKNYADYPKFNQIIGQVYRLATRIKDGETPYLWGWFPWFTNYNDGIKYYEWVISNAPYSDYAPMALINIALIADEESEFDISIDALDRLINAYPQSVFVSDAYLQMAKTYKDMVQGPDYDQASAARALDFYQDFLILFPKDSSVAVAEQGYEFMLDTRARSRLILGDFYYHYRDNFKAATIFYNETITIAPNSLAAQEAREKLKLIADGEYSAMTPVDWFFGRYQRPEYDVDEDEIKARTVSPESYQLKPAESFMSEETAPTIAAQTSAEKTEQTLPEKSAEPEAAKVEAKPEQPKSEAKSEAKKAAPAPEFAPVFGPDLDKLITDDGTLEDKDDSEENENKEE